MCLGIHEDTGSFTFSSTSYEDHLADLRKSGLTDKTIETYQIETVRPQDLNRVLSPRAASKAISAYRIFSGSYSTLTASRCPESWLDTCA